MKYTNLRIEQHDIHGPHPSTEHDRIDACQCDQISPHTLFGQILGSENLEEIRAFEILHP